jgi:hypothetical protein
MALHDGMGMTSPLGRGRRKILVAIAMAVLIALNLHGVLAADGGSGAAATVISEAGPSGLLGDFDGNCTVDILDIMQVACRWQTSCDNPNPDDDPDTPNYDALYDVNNDCVIDIVDIMLVAAHWGDTCPWVSGYVWNDDNGDGVWDEIEGGMAGVTIDLYCDNDGDGVLSSDDTYLHTQTTAEGGSYQFSNLSAGDYILQVTDTDGVLSDYALTTDNNPLAVHLREGEVYSEADFGYEAVAYPGDTAVNLSSFCSQIKYKVLA